MGKEEILRENFQEYFESAELAFESKKFNSSVTLFFKAVCAGVDLFILLKEGFVPSSHTKRFRLVQEKYKEIYDILDKDFPFYQDSYVEKPETIHQLTKVNGFLVFNILKIHLFKQVFSQTPYFSTELNTCDGFL